MYTEKQDKMKNTIQILGEQLPVKHRLDLKNTMRDMLGNNRTGPLQTKTTSTSNCTLTVKIKVTHI